MTTRSTRMGPRGLLAHMALLVASLALVAVSAEVVVRAIGAGFRYGYPDGLFREDPDTGYSMVPSFGPARFIKHEFETTVSTNTAGFFDREHGPPQPGVVRLLSLGDSNVWGAYGIRRRENYSAQLVGELRSKFAAARFEVINAGVPGWGTDNELDFYRSRGFRYGAQIVLLSFTVANDFFDNRLTGEMAVRKGRLVRAESVRASRGVLGQARNFFFSHSHFYRWAEIRLVQHPAISSWMRETGVRHGGFFSGGDAGLRELFSLNTQAGRQTQLAVETRKRLVELNEAARLHSARLVVFLVPAKFQVVASDIAAVQARFEVDLAALLAPQRYLRDLCAELDIPLIDSTEAIRRADAIEPQFWRLNPHFNRAGNRLAAEIIAKTLVEDPALREAAAAIPLKN